MAEVSLVAEMSARVATTWPPTWPVCSCAMWSSDHSNTNLSSSTLFHWMCACIQPCQVLERGPYQIIQRFCFKTFRTDLYRLAFSVSLKTILRCAACSSSSRMLCTVISLPLSTWWPHENVISLMDLKKNKGIFQWWLYIYRYPRKKSKPAWP